MPFRCDTGREKDKERARQKVESNPGLLRQNAYAWRLTICATENYNILMSFGILDKHYHTFVGGVK